MAGFVPNDTHFLELSERMTEKQTHHTESQDSLEPDLTLN